MGSLSGALERSDVPHGSTIPPRLLGKNRPPRNLPPYFAAFLSPEKDKGNDTTSAYAREKCSVSEYDQVIDNSNNNIGHAFWFRSELQSQNGASPSRKAKGYHRWHLKKTLKVGQWERRIFQLSHGTKRCVKNNRAFYLHEFKNSDSTVAYYLLRRIYSRPAVAQTGYGSHQPHIVPNIEASNQQVPSAPMGPFPNSSHFVASNGAHYGSASRNEFGARSTGQAAGYVVPSGSVSHYASLGCEGNNQTFRSATGGEQLYRVPAMLAHNLVVPSNGIYPTAGYLGAGLSCPVAPGASDTGPTWGFPNDNNNTFNQATATFPNNVILGGEDTCYRGEGLLCPAIDTVSTWGFLVDTNNIASITALDERIDEHERAVETNDNFEATAIFPNNATLGGEVLTDVMAETKALSGEVHMPQEIKSWSIAHDMFTDAGGLDGGHTIMPAAFLGHETGRMGFDESIWCFDDGHDVSINANGDWELDSINFAT